MLICVLYSIGWVTGRIWGRDYSNLPPDLPALCLYHPSYDWNFLPHNSNWTENDPTPDNEPDPMVVAYNWLYTVLTVSTLIFGYSTRVLLLFF